MKVLVFENPRPSQGCAHTVYFDDTAIGSDGYAWLLLGVASSIKKLLDLPTAAGLRVLRLSKTACAFYTAARVRCRDLSEDMRTIDREKGG